jgi:hypothetical protein
MNMKNQLAILFATMVFSITGMAEAQHVLLHEIEQPARLQVAAAQGESDNPDFIYIGFHNAGWGGTPPYRYQWSPEEYVEDPEESFTMVTELYSDGYVLSVIDTRNCIASDTVFIEITSGVWELRDNIVIYPNPAGNYVKIRSSGASIEYVQLINMNGISMNVNIEYGGEVLIDVSNLASGAYYLLFRRSDELLKRIVLVK